MTGLPRNARGRLYRLDGNDRHQVTTWPQPGP